jgi:hypothetical protein
MLRGAAGAVVGLPLLECMLDGNGEALAGGAALPKRYLLCFGGYSLGADGDPMVDIVPPATGPGYALGRCLLPLGGHHDAAGAAVKERISVVSGLTIPSQQAKNSSLPIPPGGRTAIFHFHANPLFTGMRSLPWVDTDITNGVVTGKSSDQMVADAIGAGTVFPSLAYRVQALYYNTQGMPDGHDVMSYGDGGAAIVPQASPRQAYDALFTGFVPDDPAVAAAKAFELEKRKSVLDLVDRRMNGLMTRVSAADRVRLDKHYQQIRAIEELLAATPPDQQGACQLLPDPGADPALGGQPSSPTDYDVNQGYSGEDLRARVFCDLVHMALTCDLTRSATLMFTMLQSFMNIHPITGHAWNHHETHHQGTTSELEDAIAWHMDHFGYLVAKLRDTSEGAGSLLDSCAVVFMNEGGYGYGYEDGSTASSHSTDGMLCLVAGGAGGLRQGEHIVAPPANNHLAQLLVSAMNAVGVSAAGLGEVTGNIPELFT